MKKTKKILNSIPGIQRLQLSSDSRICAQHSRICANLRADSRIFEKKSKTTKLRPLYLRQEIILNEIKIIARKIIIYTTYKTCKQIIVIILYVAFANDKTDIFHRIRSLRRESEGSRCLPSKLFFRTLVLICI